MTFFNVENIGKFESITTKNQPPFGMNLIRNLNRVERLHQLILAEKTGTPQEVAKRLGISKSALFIMIDELNSLNLKVSYSSKYETFFYDKELKRTILEETEVVRIHI